MNLIDTNFGNNNFIMFHNRTIQLKVQLKNLEQTLPYLMNIFCMICDTVVNTLQCTSL